MLRVHLCNKYGVDCLQENDNNWCNGDSDWIGGQCVQSNCDHEELIALLCEVPINGIGNNIVICVCRQLQYFL